MPARRKAHGKHRVSRLQQGKENGKVCRRAAVGLHVCVFRSEQTAGALPRQLLDLIHIGAAAVIAPSGISLGVLVGKHASSSQQHCLGDYILGRYEFDIAPLAGKLARAGGSDLRVEVGQFFKKHRLIAIPCKLSFACRGIRQTLLIL